MRTVTDTEHRGYLTCFTISHWTLFYLRTYNVQSEKITYWFKKGQGFAILPIQNSNHSHKDVGKTTHHSIGRLHAHAMTRGVHIEFVWGGVNHD